MDSWTVQISGLPCVANRIANPFFYFRLLKKKPFFFYLFYFLLLFRGLGISVPNLKY